MSTKLSYVRDQSERILGPSIEVLPMSRASQKMYNRAKRVRPQVLKYSRQAHQRQQTSEFVKLKYQADVLQKQIKQLLQDFQGEYESTKPAMNTTPAEIPKATHHAAPGKIHRGHGDPLLTIKSSSSGSLTNDEERVFRIAKQRAMLGQVADMDAIRDELGLTPVAKFSFLRAVS